MLHQVSAVDAEGGALPLTCFNTGRAELTTSSGILSSHGMLTNLANWMTN